MELLLDMLQSPSFHGFVIAVIGMVMVAVGSRVKKLTSKVEEELNVSLEVLEAQKGKEHVEMLKGIADMVVKTVQQSFKEAGGPAKLSLAISKMKEHVGSELDISDERLEDYIEAAYGSAKKGFKEVSSK